MITKKRKRMRMMLLQPPDLSDTWERSIALFSFWCQMPKGEKFALLGFSVWDLHGFRAQACMFIFLMLLCPFMVLFELVYVALNLVVSLWCKTLCLSYYVWLRLPYIVGWIFMYIYMHKV